MPPRRQARQQAQEARTATSTKTEATTLRSFAGIQTATATATETEQAIDAKQSTAVVQTLLHGSISSLLWFRKLLPVSCFVDQSYAAVNSYQTYEEYAASIGEQASSAERDPHVFKSLKRGRSTRADRLLTWLEGAVFDALSQGFLRSMHISIAENPHQLENLLELYKFTFKYKSPVPGSSHAFSDVEMTSPGGNQVTAKRARSAMADFVQKLINMCGTVPDLPDSRFLTMHLFYNEKRPKGYQPEGFAVCTDHAINFPVPMQTTRFKTDAGFHAVYLEVSHLAFSDVDDQEWPATIPGNLLYKYPASRLYEINPTSSNLGDKESQTRYTPGDSHPMEDVETTTEIMAQVSHPTSRRGDDGAESHQSSPSTADYLDLDLPIRTNMREATTSSNASTPFPEDLATRDMIQKMLQPSVLQNDTQDLQVESTQAPALQLSQTTIQQLELRRSIISPQRPTSFIQGRSSPGALSDNVDKVACQCGWDGEEDGLIHCDFCETWQHLHCYGYKGLADTRIPRTHACYQCLLQGREDVVLRQLCNLAQLRRIVNLLEGQDFSSMQQLDKETHCDLQTATKSVQYLRKVGLVTQGKRIALVRSEANIRRVEAEYFDPSFKIAHHLSLPPSPNNTFQPATTATQNSKVAGGGDSQVGSPSHRYPRRSRNNLPSEASDVATPMPSRAQRKRTRELDVIVDANASNSKRRMTTSLQSLAIDFGSLMTPPSAGRS